jgi:hypothetical protein
LQSLEVLEGGSLQTLDVLQGGSLAECQGRELAVGSKGGSVQIFEFQKRELAEC